MIVIQIINQGNKKLDRSIFERYKCSNFEHMSKELEDHFALLRRIKKLQIYPKEN